MNRQLTGLTVLLVIAAATGCGSGGGDSSGPIPRETVTITATPSSTPTQGSPPTSTAPETTPLQPRLYPKGYPKVVLVSSLPDQVRSWYEMSHDRKAVAVAPGVWAEMSPGATMQDALDVGVLDGFCSSIKAYERKFRDSEDMAGTCW
jgi:hypothetical protein